MKSSPSIIKLFLLLLSLCNHGMHGYSQVACDSWLQLPGNPSFVSVGDLDVPGTSITVEAVFYQTGVADFEGDIVSKHNSPADVNYLLRANHAHITTDVAYFATPDICEAELNKRYHIAMVYDGATLKFYRNGFLMAQTNARGNLYQNNWQTQIGWYAPQFWNSNFIGYVNEVRIWNVARTQTQLKSFMNNSLPNPITQPGLVAYYTFNNLLNKQGNASWNGTLTGTATINNTVPNCVFIADSCKVFSPQASCNGSLGNPVVNISFGSGNTNPGPSIPIAVPGASTNYNLANYATGTPPAAPIDGDYALVNVVPANSAWHSGATDHTGNPNGYMAFFNSAPSPGEFYRQTVQNLCAGTTYEFAAWIANAINAAVLPGAIKPNLTFQILDPITQDVLANYNTGDIDHFNQFTWQQYSFLFTMPTGNSSVTLVIANNNIGGNAQPGNDLAIDDITFRPCGPLTKASFAQSSLQDAASTTCNAVNLFGTITGSFNAPAFQWQISSDNGLTFSDLPGATSLNATIAAPARGQYILHLLSAETGNINSVNCRFISNQITLTVTGCNTVPGISNVINDYAAVLAIDPCNNRLTVNDAGRFNVGDTVVLMQMKGAQIDDRNSSDFGTVLNQGNAGAFEFNEIRAKAGNVLELKNTMLNAYEVGGGRTQLIRVPYYNTVSVDGTLTALPWNGTVGGVLVLNSAAAINLNAPIDVSATGFRGGQIGAGFSCGNVNSWAAPAGTGGNKGEGIAEAPTDSEAGGAKLANGGGGAYSANTGGGGGSNYGAGGLGGKQSNTCPQTTQSIGGAALDYSGGTKVFAGGGGGGGQQDDNQPVAVGGNGGGIVIIKTPLLNANNQVIRANGADVTTLVRDEGGAGGGAGGSVLLFVDNYTGGLQVEAKGGVGSSNDNIIYPLRCHGPGGGGGGGFLGFNTVTPYVGITSILDGGKAGTVLNSNSACFNTTHGATDGAPGGSKLNLTLPVATTPFQKNIDSVQFNITTTGCKSFSFNGTSYTNSSPIQQWQWSFGDGATATGQNTAHNYSTGGSYTIQLIGTDGNGCTDSAIAIVQPRGIQYDFVWEQQVCNPLNVQFRAVGDSTPEIYWSMGDGSFPAIRHPQHVFADTGSYTIRYSTGNGPCVDTISKQIYIGQRPGDIIVTPDTTICFGSNQLLSSNIDSTLPFCWQPVSYLNNPALANPTATPPGTIRYTLTAATRGTNLLSNAAFSDGNTGFSTDFNFTGTGQLSTGSYTISSNSTSAGIGAASCADHSTGSGNMLLVNASSRGDKVWQQTVPVTPNTNYIFSCWIQTVNATGAPMLRFTINGNAVLDSLRPPATSCTWTQHFVTWNSGSATTARLTVVDITTPGFVNGRDQFAIDDISFGPYEMKREAINLKVDTALVTARQDTSVCKLVPVTLTTTGAVRYSWTPSDGLSNTSIANPVATPAVTTTYYVSGINQFGCTAKDSVTITVKPIPVIAKTADTAICRNTNLRLFAGGGIAYLWSPAASLSNTTIATPVATPTTNTTYRVVVTGSNNCTATDSVRVSIRPLPNFTVSESKSICMGSTYQLNATGGNVYRWSPAALVTNPAISNPVANTSNTGLINFTVIAIESVCGIADTLYTDLEVLPIPTISAFSSNNINCAVGSTQLRASGGQQYVWTPTASVNNAQVAAPIASPTVTTRYTVKGTSANGCSNTDTVTVLVDFTGKVSYSVPNAFSPNGDGKNDCFQLRYFGQIRQLQLSVYNRFGNKVFETSNPAACWDGYYKGDPAPAGNYVYYLKAITACGPVERKGNLVLIR